MTLKSAIVTVLGYLVAVGGGLFIGYSDKHASEPQGTVLALLELTFVLGLAQPVRAWRWPILVGLWVPLLDFLLPPAGLTEPGGGLHAFWSYMALLLFVEAVGFFGAYAGMGLAAGGVSVTACSASRAYRARAENSTHQLTRGIFRVTPGSRSFECPFCLAPMTKPPLTKSIPPSIFCETWTAVTLMC